MEWEEGRKKKDGRQNKEDRRNKREKRREAGGMAQAYVYYSVLCSLPMAHPPRSPVWRVLSSR